jgi:protein-S-isoprenylcysteine O-methyltransferase Ste14
VSSSRIPSLGPRGEGWVALQVVLALALVYAAATYSGGDLAIAMIGGWLLMGVGLALMLVGILQLRSAATPLPKPTANARLIESGLYNYARHPIYAGLIVAALGVAVHALSWPALLLTLLLAVVLDLKTRREEIWLRERFPDYPAYAARTKRFIPGVY